MQQGARSIFSLMFEMNCNCSNYLLKEQGILEKDWTLKNL